MSDGPTLMRWVVGYHGLYLVRNDGAVFNRQGREMAQRVDRYGYANVRLTSDRQAWKKVHRLVCEAWHGTPSAGLHAAHIDGNPLNNCAANLAWKTPRENDADKDAHGTRQAGEHHPRAKLSAEQVAEIRASQDSSRVAALKYGVNPSQIVRIRNGARWAEGIAQ